MPLSFWDTLLTTILGHEAARAGDRTRVDSLFAATRRFLDERRADGANSARWLYEGALLEAAAGRREAPLRELEAAYRAGFRWTWMLEHNPMLDGVRDHPRFVRLLQRVGADVAAMRERAFRA